jgi:hypothetical protein
LMGPIEFSVKPKRTVNIPIWAAGVGAIALGVVLLVVGTKK